MIRQCSIVLLLFFCSSINGQESAINFFQKSDKNERFEAGAPILSGMILPLYTPEMQFAIHGVTAVTFKTRRNNSYLSHSVLPASMLFNPKGSVSVNLCPEIYWFDDLMLMRINAYYKNREDNYWGVGMENAQEVKKSASTTAYKRISYSIQPDFLIRIHDHFYSGLSFDFNSFRANNMAGLMLEDPDVLQYGNDIFSGGIGIMAVLNHHNSLEPASGGYYISAKGMTYTNKLKSDYSFQQVHIEYNHYIPVIRKGSLLALQLKTVWSFGDIPWVIMPQSGRAETLRGYYKGQYRDKNMALMQIEYRHFFNKKGSDQTGRHGFVYWIGGGTVFHKVSEIKNAILSTGAGYRYRLQPNIILRLDLGFGTENVGIYLGLTEAF